MIELQTTRSIKALVLGSFLLLSLIFAINGNWRSSRFPIQMDANGYYIYLPAVFIYHDLENLNFVNDLPEQFDRKYFLYPNKNGGFLTKYAPGIAILHSPFFFVAHVTAITLDLKADGYSAIYRLALGLSTLFYTCLGLWLLALVLLRYFRPAAVFVTIGLLLFATNIFFYGLIQPGISHNYVFCMVCALLYCLDKWQIKQNWVYFSLAGTLVGFCSLIRPTEALVGLIPIGYFIYLWKTNQFNATFLKKHSLSILGAIVGFTLSLLPLLIYWKFATGNWVAYTYEQEGFYFDRPSQIWYGLFGFRKGWFVYTPLVFLACLGWFQFRNDKRFDAFRLAFWLYFPINLFIVLSWYCWWYGGCFGMRALIPALALAAFPIAWLFDSEKIMKLPILMFSGLCLVLNVFQSYQYQQKILHMDAMTWKSYIYIFGKWRLTEEQKAKRDTLLDHPDYLQRGKKLDEYFK